MRALTPAALSALLVLTACGSNTASVLENDTFPPDEAMENTDGTMMEAEESSDAADDAMAPAADDAMAPSADARVIEMEVTDWAFSPSAISVKQGEKLIIRLKGSEGKHSLAIEDLGINVEINPGETKDIEIPTDKAGTFAFRCRIPCGSGHKDMKGEIVVI